MSTAEQIIAKHDGWGYSTDLELYYCLGNGCNLRFADIDEWAAHVVAALTNAGKTIVELPEADDVDGVDQFEAWGLPFELVTVSALKPGVVAIDDFIGQMSPTNAREFAAALLAAARVAEGGER